MTLAVLHSAALAIVATCFVVGIFRDDLGSFPSVVNPVVSTLAGTFLGFVSLNVWRASTHAPRTRLDGSTRGVVALSGCIVGFFGLAFLGLGPRFFRF